MKTSTTATLYILLATLFWGMTFAFIRDAVSVISPFSFLFWRFGTASLLLFIFFYKNIHFNKKLITQGIWLGLFLGGTVIFQTIGLQYTTASTASFITALSVIMVMIFSCILERQWPNLSLSIAVILATLGVGLITLTNGLTLNQGDVWIFLCAIAFAIYIILAGKFTQSNQPLTLTLIQMLTIFVLAGIFFVPKHGLAAPTHLNVWIDILFCAIFASIISFTLQLKFQKYVSASKTAIIFATEPIFATITAAIYLGERLSIQFAIGATLIFASILISEMGSKKKVFPQD